MQKLQINNYIDNDKEDEQIINNKNDNKYIIRKKKFQCGLKYLIYHQGEFIQKRKK